MSVRELSPSAKQQPINFPEGKLISLETSEIKFLPPFQEIFRDVLRGHKKQFLQEFPYRFHQSCAHSIFIINSSHHVIAPIESLFTLSQIHKLTPTLKGFSKAQGVFVACYRLSSTSSSHSRNNIFYSNIMMESIFSMASHGNLAGIDLLRGIYHDMKTRGFIKSYLKHLVNLSDLAKIIGVNRNVLSASRLLGRRRGLTTITYNQEKEK